MLTDKEIKAKYKPIFWKDPDKYYATKTLKEDGFHRNLCTKCKKPFWNKDKKRNVCGDPSCSNEASFDFIGNTPAKNKMTYAEVWQEFSKMFKKFGYTPIARYPVVSRWNATMEYTNASIAAFQPFVISGEVEPPANPLVLPQFSLRFSDVDNVGITMSHMTCFNMIGQHMFVSPKDWDQNKVFRHIKQWINEGMGIDDSEITFHEDAWAGGGNLGCCMEYFSRGCEIGNQVYMLYEQTQSGAKDLKIKVLDMGMGMERAAWFSQGCNTIYDATFPKVIKKILKKTGVKFDEQLIKKYVPYAGLLNLDETDDIQKQWERVSKAIDVPVDELKEKIIMFSAVYSIAEHARGLLITLSDGGLPSNVGGGYNLRILARRAMGFIDNFSWNLNLGEVCRWHAEDLKEIFPELSDNLDEVDKILEVERKKYMETKNKSRSIVTNLLSKGTISEQKLLELYDSQGISPDMVKKAAQEMGKKIEVPADFFAKVSERHEIKKTAYEMADELDLSGVAETEIMYYRSFDIVDFDAAVMKVLGNNVILNRTAFYPTSGGQAHDIGTLNGKEVIDVFKQGAVVVHVLNDASGIKKGDKAVGKIDFDRRLQLAQHHTATHIINGAARKILGNHIWQAGANKDIDKARLDITHYESLTEYQEKEIEKLSNEIIEKNLPVYSTLMPRNLAEAEHGMRLYQGGAVPGKVIRVINVPGFDVEACGGTHLSLTGQAKKIKILRSTKIQDGIVRIEFSAGNAAEKAIEAQMDVLQVAAKELGCQVNQVPGRAKELFMKWKKAKKAIKKNKELDVKELELTSVAESEGDLLALTAAELSAQPQHVNKTIARFKKELDEMKEKLRLRVYP
ncbi:MAG: alanine--tRNA ligase [Nanoarchaeota archaeon]|nr:alanine--tRNA ligase [Nanoarchaeota archaeon]